MRLVNRVNYEDLIINLFIFDNLERKSANMSNAKLIYIFEENLYRKNMIGAHYKMYRYKMGPYNKSISTHLKNLSYNGFLNRIENFYDKIGKNVNIYQSNYNSRKFIKEIDELIQHYSIIFDNLISVIDEFGKMNAEELKNYLYSLDNTGRSQIPINTYKMFEIILDPDSLKNPNINFRLDDDWYDFVEILLNPNIEERLVEGIKNAQSGNLKPL